MKYNELENWITGEQNFDKGIKLHARYGSHANVRKIYLCKNPYLRKQLLLTCIVELRNQCKPPEPPAPPEPEKKNPVKDYLKKEFPKLDYVKLPKQLKDLIQVRIDDHNKAVELYARLHLQSLESNEQKRFETVKNLVLSVKENWEIWQELNHWQIYGEIYGKYHSLKPDEYLAEINELEKENPVIHAAELLKRKRRCEVNLNRFDRLEKLTPKQERQKAEWIKRLTAITKCLTSDVT